MNAKKIDLTPIIYTEQGELGAIENALEPTSPALAASLEVSPIALGMGSTIRDLPNTYAPSVAVLVSIAVTPGSGTLVYAVEETPPTGWVVSNINESGQWDSVNKRVKWGPFFDANPRTLTYQATPQSGETGVKTFIGTASFDGTNVTIGGGSTIASSGLSPRGDFNGDGKTDILWRHKTTGQNVIWFMNGATYSSYVELMQVADTNWQIVGTGDFNGMGRQTSCGGTRVRVRTLSGS